MQTYDLLMLLVLVAATIFGFWKGMAWQIASLASLGVSYIASLRFSEQLAPVFGEHAPWNRFVAMLAIYIPSSLAVYGAVRWWHASNDSPWRGALERGLAPVAVGLVFAGAVAVMQAAEVSALQIFTTLLAAGLLTFTRIGIYAIMAAAALVFALLQSL